MEPHLWCHDICRTDLLSSLLAAGVQESRHAAFVLVAGGLGERLGYSGIKLALPADLARGACFLQVPARLSTASKRNAA
jgi:UDP-N-acetylglucosamine pyrophosphorylase